MRIEMKHVGQSSTVLMELETESEARYTDERLARIAYSQDRLRWLGADTGKVSAKSARLRRLPRDRRFPVLRVGAAASVTITLA